MDVALIAVLSACCVIFVQATDTTGHAQRVAERIRVITCDMLDFHSNLLSRDSVYILGACMPVYLLARQSDHALHSCFYNFKKHKNNYKLPTWCTACADVGALAVPMLLIGVRALCASSTHIRVPAQVFLMSLPFTWVTKRVLKLFTWDCCLRPPRQEFSCCKSVYGGFPSGHMFEAVYMTALFGSVYGCRWGAALTCGAFFLGASFVACNRHYLSQLVAGATLGFIYAHAARKLIDKKLSYVQISNSGTLCKIAYIF